MSETFERIKKLVDEQNILPSEHAFMALADDELGVLDITSQLHSAIIVEDYPDYQKGPAVLVMTESERVGWIHSVWGIPAGAKEPATLITAYVPDPQKWYPGFLKRRKE